MSEALKEAEDRHVHQLRVAYLVTRARSWKGSLSTHQKEEELVL